MKKVNYLVSRLQEFYIKSSKEVVVDNKYIYDYIQFSNLKSKYKKITLPLDKKLSKKSIEKKSAYVNQKYEKYVSIFSERLNHIHGKDHNREFWKRAFGLGLLSYISVIHQAFESYNKKFNIHLHDAIILDPHSFETPKNFSELRALTTSSDFGREEIFSIYCHSLINQKFRKLKLKSSEEFRDKKLFFQSFYDNLLNAFTNKKAKNGFIGCLFSRFFFLSHISSIAIIFQGFLNFKGGIKNLDIQRRIKLSCIENGFDRFDKFFFDSSRYLFPSIYIEDFGKYEKIYKSTFDRRPNLKFIYTETFFCNSEVALFAAYAYQEKKITYGLEHNCLFHLFCGAYFEHLIDLVDFYLTIGWKSKKNKKIVSFGSLYNFTAALSKKKLFSILYISAPSHYFVPFYSSSRGEDAWNMQSHFSFCEDFFRNLDLTTLKKLSYRAYPNISCGIRANKEAYLAPYLAYTKGLVSTSPYLAYTKGFVSTRKNSREQMAASKILVIDYISTAYLEALVMNIPTVVLFNSETYYLNNDFGSIFDELIQVGIFHTNSASAARLLNIIHSNPMKWWRQPNIQAARKSFLDKNLNYGNKSIELFKKL